MGREIRRVPIDWEHPSRRNERTGAAEYQPMCDKTLAEAVTEWEDERAEYYHGSLLEQIKDGDSSPNPDYYRPEWPADKALGFAVYETVSEGTPLTPTFATESALIDHLTEHGTYWDGTGWRRAAAESFVRSGYAPSMVIVGGRLFEGASDADKIDEILR